MENEQPKEESSSLIAYIIGAVLVVAIVGGAWYFRSQNTQTPLGTEPAAQNPPVAQTNEPAIPTPTPGPITGLMCDSQYFNPKIGFAEYYLSAEGGDLDPATNVTCNFTASIQDRVIATTQATSQLTDAPLRGGKVFRCTTRAIELTPGVPTTINVTLTDDAQRTGSCSAEFTYPTP